MKIKLEDEQYEFLKKELGIETEEIQKHKNRNAG